MNIEAFALEAKLPTSVFIDPLTFVDVVRQGVSGEQLKRGSEAIGLSRKVIGSALSVDQSNISRLFRRKHLTQEQGEAALETFLIVLRATEVFEDKHKAQLWLEAAIPVLGGRTPVELLDTHKGRQMVSRTLERIEYGEFI